MKGFVVKGEGVSTQGFPERGCRPLEGSSSLYRTTSAAIAVRARAAEVRVGECKRSLSKDRSFPVSHGTAR